MMKNISSVNNNQIKNLVKLQEKSRERKKQGLFIIEGLRELSLAVSSNYEVKTIFINENIIDENVIRDILNKEVEIISLTNSVYQKVAYRESTEGVICIVKGKKHNLSDITITKKNPLIIVAEGIEKPGNLGALLRTADAAKVDAFLIANPVSDIYNPNIIRSSVGCVFTQNIGIGTSEEVIQFLSNTNVKIFTATLQNSNAYHNESYVEPTAIVVGTEATGLTKLFRDNAYQNINIPMQGKIDSMNVSVAAAILLFEAKRQRNFK